MKKDTEPTVVYVDDRLLDVLLGAPSPPPSTPLELVVAAAVAPPPPADLGAAPAVVPPTPAKPVAAPAVVPPTPTKPVAVPAVAPPAPAKPVAVPAVAPPAPAKPAAAPAVAPPPPAEPAPLPPSPAKPTPPAARPQVRVTVSPEEYFRQGVERLDRGDTAGALAAFRRCLGLKPDWTDALFNQALALWRSGKPDAATTVFERVLELDPESLDAVAALAVLALERKDEARARAYEQMLGGTAWEISYNLALLSQEQGSLRQAEVLYREVLAAKPDCVEALVNLGHVLRELGADREAADCWRRATKSDGDAARRFFPGE